MAINYANDVKKVRLLLKWQALLAGCLIILTIPFGFDRWLSVAIGAISCWLTNLGLAKIVFCDYHAQQSRKLLVRFYSAEMIRLITLPLLFLAVFMIVENVNPPWLLGTFFIVQTLPAPMISYLQTINLIRKR
jgi:F0F1-type ATP synthase assembly protein I